MMNEEEYTQCVKNMRNHTTRMDREGDYWTEEEKHRLKICFDSGMGITDIAITLQRTEPAVMQQIEKMDLYQRKENPQRRRFFDRQRGCLCNTCTLRQTCLFRKNNFDVIPEGCLNAGRVC